MPSPFDMLDNAVYYYIKTLLGVYTLASTTTTATNPETMTLAKEAQPLIEHGGPTALLTSTSKTLKY
jgi:hypothetical protein